MEPENRSVPVEGSATCLKCGAPIAGDSRHGFCFKCLFLQATADVCGEPKSLPKEEEASSAKVMASKGPGSVDLPSSANGDGLAGTPFGDYDLLECIGRGGMGIVYRARQRSLDRVVAIKMMSADLGTDPEFLERFRTEAIAAGSLHHPNIVTIHEVGQAEGRHYFVMDLIEGPSLARLADNQPLPARRAAEYLRIISEAVHYAHEHGVLHRDLKPSNVLIDEHDQPRVVDFGLARRLEGRLDLTVTGQVLGSPHYLPPEQVSGPSVRLSQRTDVYALGATLYHLLTGRPPFQAESLPQTLNLVLHSEPVTPRLLNPTIPRDLETICLKCLEKEPLRRYATARELAEELVRFLAGEPIRARPLARPARAWRWCRRNPSLAGTGAVAALAVVLGFTGVVWQLHRAEDAILRERQGRYVSEMHLAQESLNGGNLSGAREILDRQRPGPSESDLRGFEWRYLWQECQLDAEGIGWLEGSVRTLDASSDGKWLAAGSDSGDAKVWDLTTSEVLTLTSGRGGQTYVTISPDSRLVVFTDQSRDALGTIAIWDTLARQRLAPIQDRGSIGPLAFSRDGKWFGYGMVSSTYHRGLVIIDFETRQERHEVITETGLKGVRHGLDWAFTPDGRSAIYSENRPLCSLVSYEFTAQTQPRHHPETFPLTPHNLADLAGLAGKLVKPARPLDSWLAGQLSWETVLAMERSPTQGGDPLELWFSLLRDFNRILRDTTIDADPTRLEGLDLRSETRQLLASKPVGNRQSRLNRLVLEDAYPLGLSRDPFPGNREAITALTIHPGGRLLATGSGFTETDIQLWELPSFRPLRKLPGHQGWITALRFSPDGQTLASASADRSIRLWNADTGQQEWVFGPFSEYVWRLGFASDSRALFSGSNDGWIRRRSLDTDAVPHRPWRCEARLDSLTVSADGASFAGQRAGQAWLAVVGDDPHLQPLPELGTNLTCLQWSPKGSLLFAGTEAGDTLVCSTAGHQVLRHLPGPPKPVSHLESDVQGATLVVVRTTTPDVEKEGLGSLHHFQVWRTADWSLRKSWEFREGTSRFAVSPDGRRLAMGTYGGPVRLWDLQGNTAPKVLSFPYKTRSVAFSPDGRWLAASSGDLIIKVWSTATLKCWEDAAQTGTPEVMNIDHELAFSPDGNRLFASGSGGEAVKIWDLVTRRELNSLSLADEEIREVCLSRDGNRLVARNSHGDVLCWAVPTFDEIDSRDGQPSGRE